MQKKILVTGGAGFIGRHCLSLLSQSQDIIYATYLPFEYPVIAFFPTIQWIPCDLLNESALIDIFTTISPTHLLHLAWILDINSPENFKWLTVSINLLDMFIKQQGKYILLGGTCLEYQISNKACKENYTPSIPTTPYGKSKYALYEWVNKTIQHTNTKIASARIFCVYGPHEKQKRLIPSTIISLLHHNAFRCRNGDLTRDYVYVEDVADALCYIINKELTGIINIGSGNPIQLREITTLIATKLKKTKKLIYNKTNFHNNYPAIYADASLLTLYGWKPKYTLDQGLNKTIQWHKNTL